MKLLKLVPDHTNVDFMRWRNVALVLSLIATIASLAFTAYRGLNLGVDFVGGQLIRVTFAQPIDVEALRTKVDAMHLGEASIQEFGGPKTFQIRLPKPGSAASAFTFGGMASAAATMAASGSTRPGDTSRSRAISSRAFHSSRTTPS